MERDELRRTRRRRRGERSEDGLDAAETAEEAKWVRDHGWVWRVLARIYSAEFARGQNEWKLCRRICSTDQDVRTVQSEIKTVAANLAGREPVIEILGRHGELLWDELKGVLMDRRGMVGRWTDGEEALSLVFPLRLRM